MNHSMTVKSQLVAAVLALAFLTFASPASAAEQGTGKAFDHTQTGFPLIGAHTQTDCQTCHLQGVFKGTPRQCEICHAQGSRIASTFKPNTHPATVMPCTQCHGSQVSWTGARFDHTGIAPGSCATCHNGVTATGKPTGPNHPVTTASCDQCHRTTAWIPAGYDHSGVVQHTCTTCHGVTATGKPNGHVTTTQECDYCHSTRAWKPASYDHVGVVDGTCNTCHGVTAKGLSIGHIPTAGLSCDACHTVKANFDRPTKFTHAANQNVVTGGCITCHSGAYAKDANAQGLAKVHIPTAGLSCDACHAIKANFDRPTTFDHLATQNVVPGGCITCHDGTYESVAGAKGKDKGHEPTTESCDKCHNTKKFDRQVIPRWKPKHNRTWRK
jgi:hypothetical protein